jgi:cation transport ATPase
MLELGDARAERAIAGLMSIQPDRATVIRDGRESSRWPARMFA